VSDFHQDGDETTLCLHEKGDKRRTNRVALHRGPGHQRVLAKAGLTSGFLFRPRLGPRSQQLANRAVESSGLYLLIEAYLEQLPGAMKEEQLADGTTVWHCIYTPHSLRANDHHAAARRQRRYSQGAGSARAPPHYHHPDLRQAQTVNIGKRVSLAGDWMVVGPEFFNRISSRGS